ncbi:thioredoxin-like domain-containing protein [Dysgonomonas sp. Marseille-P4361]|uniref:thioredoxin-like domain-containing protein n=1 Tax=Dysgonomonas sp. Marseille-P4361 TaxID=2161820 RepID=UPI000D555E1E|nr:thioredoxin-like domain-containing protein [Dysgonomonas sp. Marseille-P4361]
MKKAFFLICLTITFILFFSCTHKIEPESADSVLLEVVLKGKNYDDLTLGIKDFGLPQGMNRVFYVKGKKQNKNHWVFEIPDSVNNRALSFKLLPIPLDEKTKTTSEITFRAIVGGDTLSTESFIYDKNMSLIEATFIRQSEYELPIGIIDNESGSEEVTIQSDEFFVDLKNYPQTELEAAMHHIDFGIYHNKELNKDKYEKDLARVLNLASKYSYSKYLLAQLAYYNVSYGDKDDLNRIYRTFTNTQDEEVSFYNNILKKYLEFNPQSFSFENVELENSLTGKKEKIIANPDKYNLIVFSASWCKWCHKAIPLLKEIYEKKREEIDLIYITIDEEKYMDYWRKLLEKESIPWRSLSLLYDEHGIAKNYGLYGIPYMMLISPDGEGQIFNVYTEEDKKELYKLLEAK